jgi:hypothetical protein
VLRFDVVAACSGTRSGKIGLSRSYLDGRVSQIRIHHADGVCKVPVDGLEDGQLVATTILAMFEEINWARASRNPARTEPMLGEYVGERRLMQASRQSTAVGDYSQVNVPQVNVDFWAHELTALQETLARRSEKISGAMEPREERIRGKLFKGWLRLKRQSAILQRPPPAMQWLQSRPHLLICGQQQYSVLVSS